MEFEHGHIITQDYPEVKIHYVHVPQKANAPVVLLLHGFPEFWYTWKDYLAPLSQAGFHPVAVDLRGYNDSSKPMGKNQYDLDRLVRDIERVILHFGKRTFLVGHDWGGIITLELAARFPELCEGIVVMNAPDRNTMLMNMQRSLGLTLKQLGKFWYAMFFQLPVLPEKFLRLGEFLPIDLLMRGQAQRRDAYPRQEMEHYKEMLRKGRTLTSALNYYRANFTKLLHKRIGQITRPTMLIWGEKDSSLHRDITKNLERYFTFPVEKHFFPRASHWVHREMPNEVIKHLISFFKLHGTGLASEKMTTGGSKWDSLQI